MYPFLNQVYRPLRYIGNEIGSIHKEGKIKFAICYPDLYEIGMGCQSIKVIYGLLNSISDVSCERIFSPAIDFENYLRKYDIPLCSLESFTPLNKFDCIGFTLQYELTYTNILNILELGKIPLYSEDRKEKDPIIIGGGPCAFNPFPLFPFFDCFAIGEAEVILPNFISLIRKWNAKEMSRNELLKEISNLPGIFVPLYPKKTKRVYKENLSTEFFINQFIVPFIPTERDELVIELSRGCTRGCRFCQPGMITRPYREREINEIISLVKKGVEYTGYLDVSLLSLSAGDHSHIIEVLKELNKLKLNVSLPSLRGETLTDEIGKLIGKGGITIAPETGTETLREKINKPIKDEEILKSAEIIAKYPFTHLKLYYMVGLPYETEKDINGIIELTKKIMKIAKKRVNITISPFIPRPHTPFQYKSQANYAVIEEKINYIKQNLHRVKIKHKNNIMSFIEGVISRGDVNISKVIERAYKLGAKFDAWHDKFNFHIWQKAFDELSIDPFSYLKENASFCCDIIDSGVKLEFLKNEENKHSLTLDCRIVGCNNCGVCKKPNLVPMHKEIKFIEYGRKAIVLDLRPKVKMRIRVKYSKDARLKFLGHLDLVRAFTLAVVRANIPVEYSQGMVKRPKLSFSPPLPFGATSSCEYVDIFCDKLPPSDVKSILQNALPSGINILEINQIFGTSLSLFEKFNKTEYKIGIDVNEEKLKEFLTKNEILIDGINIRNDVINLIKDGENIIIRMKIGKTKPTTIIKALTNLPEEKINEIKIERINLFH